MDKKEFCEFIQFKKDEPTPSSDYYWNIFKASEGKTFFLKPNWITFLFGAYWFAYRRMYLWYFVFYFVMSQLLQMYFMGIGFDRGASGAYSSLMTNTLIVFLANPLYMRFLEKKMESKDHLGVHVRLFSPILFLFRNIVFLLVIQLFGIILEMPSVIKGIYPFAALALGHCIFMYGYYFYDWKNQ